MTARAVRASVYRDLRAVAPLWALAFAVTAVAVVLPDTFLRPLAVLGYVLGSIVIGAQVIGHEYGSSTLASLMTQPVSRRAAFGGKVVVSVVLIALLTAAAAPVVFELREFRYAPVRIAIAIAMLSIFVAPSLTMLCRNTIAGVVFSIGIPGTLKVLGEILGLAWFGAHNSPAIEAFSEQFLWNAMAVLCALAVPASWLIFERLQVIEGRGPQIHLPRWFGSARQLSARRVHPLRQLVRKELHLHQMAFVIAALYVAGVAAAMASGVFERPNWVGVLVPVSALYLFAAPVLVGATAIAEERSLGTLGYQSLLPVAAWKQWSVKVAVAMLLALLLAVALPAALLTVVQLPGATFGNPLRTLVLALTLATLLAACGVYASAVAANSQRALLGSVAMVTATFFMVHSLVTVVFPVLSSLDIPARPTRMHRPELVILGFGIFTAAVLLWLAYVNRVQRRRMALLGQACGLATIVLAFVFCAYWFRL